jgi:phage tail-like protein
MADTQFAKDTMLGLSNRFRVTVGGVDLGNWATCQGLNVTFNPVALDAGGDYGYMHILPGQVKYGNVKITRAMSAKESQSLQKWLSGQVDSLMSIEGNVAYEDGTATITLLDAHGGDVVHWTLRGVHPNSWTGPSFDANSSKIAMETLELVHEGFL